jgi:hypothetical protein
MAMRDNRIMHNEIKKASLVFGIIVSVIALLICLLGIWLIYLKSSGQTHFKLFSQEFRSDNVGIAAIFIGAVVLVIALRRTFRALENITTSYRGVMNKILDSDEESEH